jgi:tungstate transport system substrate-binding protein
MKQVALLVLSLILAAATAASSQERSLTVAATASIGDSGLVEFLLLRFRERTGISARLLSRSSALDLMTAEGGTADVVIVNDPDAVDHFINAHYAIQRRKLMHERFIIVGPAADPLKLKGSADAAAALREIAKMRAPIVSRSDDSGTYLAEQRAWQATGVNPKTRAGNWYIETGLTMGAALDLASRLRAHVFTSRAAWLAHRKQVDLAVLVDRDPLLLNQYEVVQSGRGAKSSEAVGFLNWLTTNPGQAAIASYRIDGDQAFFPNAEPNE